MADHPDSNANALGEHFNAFGNASARDLRPRNCANPVCEKSFKPARYWQRFCSVVCRNQEYWSRHERKTVPKDVPITTNQTSPMQN